MIEHTGSSEPANDHLVALKHLRFSRPDDALERSVVLRDVPPVLLSECYNDLAEIAAAGSGFDPQWQGLRP